jgi:TRAP-type C4-dicarboxylate transport system permease small subunit
MRPAPRWLALIDRVADGLLAASLLVAVTCILVQVVCRYGFGRPITWLDELAVLDFAWLIFLGAAVAQRTDSHVAMDTLVQALPDRPRLALYLLRCAAMLAVLGLLFAKGIELTSRMASIDYPAMGISRGFLYAALPTTIPLFAYYLVSSARRALAGRRA